MDKMFNRLVNKVDENGVSESAKSQLERLPIGSKLLRIFPSEDLGESDWIVVDVYGNTYLYRYTYNMTYGGVEVMVPYIAGGNNG